MREKERGNKRQREKERERQGERERERERERETVRDRDSGFVYERRENKYSGRNKSQKSRSTEKI